jgi:hypothetical protein
MRQLIALFLLLAPLAAHAQANSIAPGMSRSQVVAAFGEPVTMRSANEYTYLFYRNACGKACGMNDLVVLRRDSVVDAILRSASRRYTGTSSSPAPTSRTAARTRPAKAKTMTIPAKAAPAATSAPAPSPMKPPRANDVRPSIPAGEPILRKSPPPAKSSAPSTKPTAP